MSLLIDEVIRDLGIEITNEELYGGLMYFRATSDWPFNFRASTSEKVAIIDRFEKLLQFYKTLDMQGTVIAACQILRSSDNALPVVFLQVDEYQDLNPIDQQFISLLASHPVSEVVVVGDDAQSIYGFRHANFKGVGTLWHSGDWVHIRFTDSFRLPAHILNAALDLLKERDYIGSKLNRKDPSDKKIITLQTTTTDLQIEAIARDISSRLSIENNKTEEALSYKDFLVLCPTRSQVDQIVEQLNNSFHLPSKSPTRPAIPDDYWTVLLFLRMAASSDPLAIRQWLPLVGFTIKEIILFRDEAIDRESNFLNYCLSIKDKRLDGLSKNLNLIRNEHLLPQTLLDVLKTTNGIELPVDFNDFVSSHVSEEGTIPSLPNLVSSLYERFGVLDTTEVIANDDRILVTTMHGAKGLEASYVYCLWMNSTFMPMKGKDEEEQRRLLYVALTRAKCEVVITFPERFDPKVHRRFGIEEISPFLEEIRGHLHIIKATAKLIRSKPLPWI